METLQTTVCPVHGTKYFNATDYRCTACLQQHRGDRVGKVHTVRLREKPLAATHDVRLAGVVKAGSTTEALVRLYNNEPAEFAELMNLVGRPAGVSKERFGIASRAAAKIPMLNADPDCIRSKGTSDGKPARVPKARVEYRLVIKPRTLKNAKLGRNAPFWGERLWLVHSLKFSKGYVITTDTGDETRTFQHEGQLRSAILRSGWEIVRDINRGGERR